MSDCLIETQISVYSEQAPQTSEHWKRIFRKRKGFIDQCSSLGAGDSVLEIGCHAGAFLAGFSGEGRRLVGIDITPQFIKVAQEQFGIEAYCADATRGLDFADGAFAVVIMTEVIEHVIDTDFLLNEIKRVLKPGGSFLISTPNICSLKNRLLLLAGLYPQGPEYKVGGAGHVRVYSANALAGQLREHGYDIALNTGLNFLPDSLLIRFPFLERWDRYFAARLPNLCSGTHIVARRQLGHVQ
jgi:2-polyprenyl-3-methyl-5-hydroxy-6-metoxy-1,4-benzoquinol methylase